MNSAPICILVLRSLWAICGTFHSFFLAYGDLSPKQTRLYLTVARSADTLVTGEVSWGDLQHGQANLNYLILTFFFKRLSTFELMPSLILLYAENDRFTIIALQFVVFQSSVFPDMFKAGLLRIICNFRLYSLSLRNSFRKKQRLQVSFMPTHFKTSQLFWCELIITSVSVKLSITRPLALTGNWCQGQRPDWTVASLFLVQVHRATLLSHCAFHAPNKRGLSGRIVARWHGQKWSIIETSSALTASCCALIKGRSRVSSPTIGPIVERRKSGASFLEGCPPESGGETW